FTSRDLETCWFDKILGCGSEQYSYIPQSFVKEFVKNCTTCATGRKFFQSSSCKASAFLNRVQVDLIAMTSIPNGGCFHFDVFICFGAPIILQSNNGRNVQTIFFSKQVSKWMEDTGMKDWSRAVPLCCYKRSDKKLGKRVNEMLDEKLRKGVNEKE
ncbi:6502_t:CDS:2, partial [Gigaspora margarita]